MVLTLIFRDCVGIISGSEQFYDGEKENVMKALTWHGKHDIRCESVPDPEIEDGRDAIIKVTACAICGSDLSPLQRRHARHAQRRYHGP